MEMYTTPEQLVERGKDRRCVISLFNFKSPVRKGSVDCWLSMSPKGLPVSKAVFKTLVVQDSMIPPPSFYWEDVDPIIPRSRRLWFVLAYGPTILLTGAVRIP